MMKNLLLFLFLINFANPLLAQLDIDGIQTRFVLYTERQKLNKSLYERTIRQYFSFPLNEDTEHRFQSAFYTVTQFLVNDSMVDIGFRKVISRYDSISWETRRSFLEAIYAINPPGYTETMKTIFRKEVHPKGVAMAALFIYRNDSSFYKEMLTEISMRFPDYSAVPVLSEFVKYILSDKVLLKERLPDLHELFRWQKQAGMKMIYSFQRTDRNFPGIAVIQGADGKFARDEKGRLITIRQLARSGSNLPYFISNGNTPQGIFSIQGIETSVNMLIGPTPNIQLIMPHEKYWHQYFHAEADTSFPLPAYLDLLPESWRDFLPIQEAFHAGRTGRSEIIAHGTTIDPEYFKDKPFYPISPTLGCLCAPENWNMSTGRLTTSEQFRLADSYSRLPGEHGYLFVINLGNAARAVSRNEIETIITAYEKSLTD